MKGEVYVVSDPLLAGRIKIGRSKNSRIRALTQSVRLEHSCIVDDFVKVECVSHRILETKALRLGRTEWFEATVDQAINAVHEATLVVAGHLPLPKNQSHVLVPLRLPKALVQLIDRERLARPDKRGRSVMVRELVAEALSRRKRATKP